MTKNPTPFTPAEVGYDASRLDVLDAHFRRMMDKGDLMAAAYCFSRDGKVFAESADGRFTYREDDDRQIDCDTIYQIASETKLFCATAIIKLAEDGLILLNQPVSDFIDSFKEAPFDKINLAHLLTHSSGMHPDGGCVPGKIDYWDAIYLMRKENPNMDWTEALTAAGVRTEPGKEWAYCSIGFVLLGAVIEKVTGIKPEKYITDNILIPCEMTNSGFVKYNMTPEDAKRLQRRGEWLDKTCEWIENPDSMPDEEILWNRTMPQTGGGMYSKPSDLVKFGNMLLNGGKYNGNRIIGRKSVEKMIEEQIALPDFCWNAGGTIRHYALGPDLRRNLTTFYSEGTFFHEGAGSCSLIIDPHERMVASWFVPYTNNQWFASGLYNAQAIIWSGLE